MKHAYMIMAHNHFYILKKLISLLDYEENDIYIHIDKKVKNFKNEDLKKIVKKSNIFFVKRIDVRWGNISQVEAILTLLETANINGNYEYYHLLSGVDLPLKSQKYIHEFFDKNKYEYIHFAARTFRNSAIIRYKYNYFFTRYSRNSIISKFLNRLEKLNILLQKKLKINRLKYENNDIMCGSEWFSITNHLVEYILDKKKWIKNRYKNTLIPDESFIQTIVYNSIFYNNVYIKEQYDKETYEACLRYVDWNRGGPYNWLLKDYDELIKSKYLFARKFEKKDIVDKIYNKIKKD